MFVGALVCGGSRVELASMRLTEYHQLMTAEFGDAKGAWISHSHVLSELGATPDELIEAGVDPVKVWEQLCEEFDVPQHRRWGMDYSTG